ncbi:unnamed protein product [Mortierella alpina]
MILPNSPAVLAAFERDIKDVHVRYEYEGQPDMETGKSERWRYEIWFHSADRVVYAIHDGPLAGRFNFQKADYQCIREGELWQCNWHEETGSVFSIVYDIPNKRLTGLLGLSKGHATQPELARGDKRNPDDLARWWKLSEVGKQTERHMISDQVDVIESFNGSGKLDDIDLSAFTL